MPKPLRHCEHSAAIQCVTHKFLDYFVVTLLAMTLLIFAATAHAKDDKKLDDILNEAAPKPAGYYSPDFCDFEITFPETPYTSKRCAPTSANKAKKCYDIHGFMMVYDLTTTVDVTANCAPSTPDNYSRYTEDVIKAALSGMIKRTNIDDYEISSQEIDDTRQGSILGAGAYAKQEQIYNAQLWVGQNSVLTIEAKLIGANHEKADEIFGDILSSVRVKNK